MKALQNALAWMDQNPRRVLGGVFACLLIIGFLSADDYALSMDEGPLSAYAQESWAYLFGEGGVPQTADWKFHNPIYQMVFLGGMKLWPSPLQAELLMQRRLISFLTFCIAWWSLFFLAKRIAMQWWWALLAAMWLVLSPRVFAHAFYNPKDIPTLVFFTLGVLLLVRMLEKPTLSRILLFALGAGFTISLRVFGLLLPAFALFFAAVHAFTGSRSDRSQWIKIGIGSLISTVIFTIIVWPLLWSDPLGNFLGAIANNTTRGDDGVYLGAHTFSFPWHYLPVWIAVTVPLSYSALFLVGLGVTVRELIRRPLTMCKENPLIPIALLWFFLPIIARLTGRIGLFDEWRHVLFLYPAFLLITLVGAQWLWQRLHGWPRAIIATLVVANMVWTAVWIVRNHPFEYVYFSVPESVTGQMEMDYWGLSYRDGLRWIAENDDREMILFYSRDHVGNGAVQMLLPEEAIRFKAVRSPAEAEYIVDTLRWSHYEHVVPAERIVHTFEAGGRPFLWIYRGPFETDSYPVYNYL